MRAFYRDSDSVQINSDLYLTNFVDFFEMDKQIMDDSEDDKNKAALRNLEMLLASSKDTESDLLQRLDSMAKDNDDLVSKVSFWIFLLLLIESFSEVNTYNDNLPILKN